MIRSVCAVTLAVMAWFTAATVGNLLLMVVLFLPVHCMLWDNFPAWYHIFFLVSLAPVVLAGAALERGLPAAIAAGSDRRNAARRTVGLR